MTPGKVFTESDLAQDSINDDTYHSWDHHSSYSSLSPSKMLVGMNRDIITAHENLKTAKVLFVTLGTARVHLLKSSNQVVSNCHKQPSDMFIKAFLSVNDVVAALRESLLLCRQYNPTLKVSRSKTRILL
jgi:GSCFA family